MRRADAACALTRWQHFSLREVTPWPTSWTYDVKVGLRQSMRIFLKNNPATFHPDPIWNDWTLGFLKRSFQQDEEEQQQQEEQQDE